MTEPLAGRRVLVTRPLDGAESLIDRLEALGATPILAPTMVTVPAEPIGPLGDALQELSTFDWLVLTSPTAVSYWLQLAGGLDWPKVATVGEATAQGLRAAGREVAFVASRATGADLAVELLAHGATGRFLLPRSDRALPVLPDRLRAAGADVVQVDLYRTLPRRWTAAERAAVAAGVDLVLLMSPSAVQGLVEQGMDAAWLERVRLVAIGPTTAEAAVRLLGRIDAVGEPPCVEGMLAALVQIGRDC